MIVNFYKIEYKCCKIPEKLLASKNIDFVPQQETSIRFNGQLFVVKGVEFDINTCTYTVYVKRMLTQKECEI